MLLIVIIADCHLFLNFFISLQHYVADYYSALKIRSAIKGLIIRARLCELLDTELTDKQDANIPVIKPDSSLESPFLQPSTTRIVSPFSNSSSKKSFQRLPTQRKVSNPLLRLASRVLSDDDNEELIQIARRSTGDHGRPSNSSSTQFQDFESPSPSNHCVDRVESFSSSPSPIGAQRKSLLKFSTSVERTGSRLGNDAAPILIKSTFSPNVSLLKSQESRGADYGQSRA